jgi:hypothetical protein
VADFDGALRELALECIQQTQGLAELTETGRTSGGGVVRNRGCATVKLVRREQLEIDPNVRAWLTEAGTDALRREIASAWVFGTCPTVREVVTPAPRPHLVPAASVTTRSRGRAGPRDRLRRRHGLRTRLRTFWSHAPRSVPLSSSPNMPATAFYLE